MTKNEAKEIWAGRSVCVKGTPAVYMRDGRRVRGFGKVRARDSASQGREHAAWPNRERGW